MRTNGKRGSRVVGVDVFGGKQVWTKILIIVLAVLLSPLSGLARADVEVTYEFSEPRITRSGEYHRVNIEDLHRFGKPGFPVLPYRTAKLLIPFGDRVTDIEISSAKKTELPGSYMIEPAQQPVPLSFEGPIEPTLPDKEIYESGGPFPEKIHSQWSLACKQGYRFVMVNLYPVEYLPLSGRISYYRQITVRIHTTAVAPAGQSSDYLPLRPCPSAREIKRMKGIVDNPGLMDSYPSMGDGSVGPLGQGASPLLDPEDYEYVIITNEALENASGGYTFQGLVAHKTARGTPATIVTTEWIYSTYDGTRPDGGEDDQTRIRNFIIDAYTTWGTEYVLLGGDGDGADVGGESGNNIIPARGFTANGLEGETNIPADMYYACLDGSFDHDGDGVYGEPTDGPGGGEVDLFAEVYVGRAPVDSDDEVSNFVRKTIAYENANPEDLSTKKALILGENLGWSVWGCDYKEEVRDGSCNHGYCTEGFPGDWDITTLCDRDDPWDKNDLIPLLNDGTHLLNHLGHANVGYNMKIYNSDVDNLTNDQHFLAYSQGCYSGSFDNRITSSGSYTDYDCIAEHFVTEASGAFAVIMNSRYGWGNRYSTDGASQHFDLEFFDAYFGEEITNLGIMNQDSKEDNAGYVSVDIYGRWCCYQITLFGDPQTRIGGAVGPAGIVILDREVYPASGDVNVLILDSDLNTDPTAIEQYSDILTITTTGGDQEANITLVETGTDSSIFAGAITIATTAVTPGDGWLQIACAMTDIITATYYDADDGTGTPATPSDTADTDCFPPVITNVEIVYLDQTTATITWDTDEPADSCVYYGITLPLESSKCNGDLVTSHTITLAGLTEGVSYCLAVASTDAATNEAMDDNNGEYFVFRTLVTEVVFSDDMESGSNGWAFTGFWHQVDDDTSPCPGSHSPSHSWWYGQDAACNYDNGKRNSGILISPPIELTAGSPVLGFMSWEETDGSLDRRRVYITTDSGASWTQIYYSGNNDADWYEVASIDLSAHAGNTIHLKFDFDTINRWQNDYRGWYVDDVLIGYVTDCGVGRLRLDRRGYDCAAVVQISLADCDLNLDPESADTATVEMTSSSEPDAETVTLTETAPNSGRFEGTIQLEVGTPMPDGKLQVAEGDEITVDYNDASPAESRTFTAIVDCSPPEITGVEVTDILYTTATINWDTNENANSYVHYGTTLPPDLNQCAPFLVTDHAAELTGLLPDTTYYFSVASTNEAGHQTIDDNDGLYYQFATEPPAVHYVPDDYATIQAAMDVALDLETIVVRHGTYTEHISFLGKAITVRSENGAEVTIIDGGGSGSVVTFDSDEGADSVLDGLAITNGSASHGGGIYCDDGTEPTIQDCIIRNNSGSGIYCGADSSPTIDNCIISGNFGASGGGIVLWGWDSEPTIANCIISNNTAEQGGGIWSLSRVTVEDCTITGNTASKYCGGGICSLASAPTVINCTISDNSAEGEGGAIFLNSTYSAAMLTNCTITGNSAGESGGGIFSSHGEVMITNCSTSGNSAGTEGGGIYCDDSEAIISNCTISDNMAATQGGGVYCAGFSYSSVTVVNTILWGDTVAGSPNEIYLAAGSIDVTYSDVRGGWTGTGNIDCDPEFLASGDHHLTPSSCCIDAGTSDGAPDEDIEGDARPDGEGHDIGADEYLDHAGVVRLDREIYPLGVDVHIFLIDSDLNTEPGVIEEYADVITITTTGGDEEATITMSETGPDTGVLTGAIAMASAEVTPGDGVLQITCSMADTITATYHDADDGTGNPATPSATAATDCLPPVITNVQVSDIAYDTATITWDTDEEADSRVYYGTTLPPDLSEWNATLATQHTIKLTGLTLGTTYYFAVASTDAVGIEAIDDNDGAYYEFQSYVLVTCHVPDDFATVQEAIDAVLDGDIIVLRPGIYAENIDFSGKAITVRSESGAGATVINGGGSGTAVTFNSGEGEDTVFQGITITNGSASEGGGIYCGEESSPTIANCFITGNTATDGGGIYCDGSSPTITNCTISDNMASADGGAIYCRDDSSPTVVNTIIWGDTAGGSPDEIYLFPSEHHPSSITVSFSDIDRGWEGTGNIDADPLFVGGGDYHLTTASPCIDAGTGDGAPDEDIDGDPRPRGCGHDIGADEFWETCCVPDDFATIQEAIDSAPDGATVSVRPGTYSENINFLGKAITVATAGAAIDGGGSESVVTFNSGEGADSILQGFTITNGSASYGGGVYCDNASPVIKDNTISGNTAGEHGGGIYCTGSSSPTIQDNAVSSNSAGGQGGGIYCDTSSPTITRNMIQANSGGGICCAATSSATIVNNMITDNTGDAVKLGGGSNARIINNTIADNNGAGIFCDSSKPTVTNCILFGNGDDLTGTTSDMVSHCDIGDGDYEGVNGNISCDPAFAGGGDYHLRASSCCIDTGTDAGAPGEDIDGDPRPRWDAYDMGADEFLQVYHVPDDFGTIRKAIENVPEDGWTIYVGPGTYVENITFGDRAITVRSVSGPEVTVIDGGELHRVVTFDSAAGPDSVLDGFTIENGHAWYSSKGAGIFCDEGSSPAISNCIVRNNSAYCGYGGGICCYSGSSPAISNCVISNNSAEHCGSGGGVGGGIISIEASPTITNCVISNNSAQSGGGVYHCGNQSPTLTNCVITDNQAEWGAGVFVYWGNFDKILNCTITDNSASVHGGGICPYGHGYWGSAFAGVVNSVLWGNTAQGTSNQIYLHEYGSINVTYSDIQYGWTGESNIDCDPQFVGGGDYHLSAGSCCIDAGTSEGAPDTDFEGDARPQGVGYDIGADEYLLPLLPCEGDFDYDGDVDGSDLAVFVAGGTGITLEEFVADFGRTDCPH